MYLRGNRRWVPLSSKSLLLFRSHETLLRPRKPENVSTCCLAKGTEKECFSEDYLERVFYFDKMFIPVLEEPQNFS